MLYNLPTCGLISTKNKLGEVVADDHVDDEEVTFVGKRETFTIFSLLFNMEYS